jgi:hypothetical protein
MADFKQIQLWFQNEISDILIPGSLGGVFWEKCFWVTGLWGAWAVLHLNPGISQPIRPHIDSRGTHCWDRVAP